MSGYDDKTIITIHLAIRQTCGNVRKESKSINAVIPLGAIV